MTTKATTENKMQRQEAQERATKERDKAKHWMDKASVLEEKLNAIKKVLND